MSTITLSKAERTELTQRATSQAGRADDARRARLVLLLDECHTWAAIRERLDRTDHFIDRWSKRFASERLAGLFSRHAGQPPPVLSPRLEARILEWTVKRKPSDGSTHWSTRKLAAQLKVSHMTIARVWRKHALAPHRLDGYLASNDPNFEAKAAEIIGLYLHPPQHAAALTRKQPSKRSIARTQCCRLLRDELNVTDSSTTAMARSRFTQHSTRRPVKCSGRPRRGTPPPSSSRSSRTSSRTSPATRRST